jgi:hypothetical protein
LTEKEIAGGAISTAMKKVLALAKKQKPQKVKSCKKAFKIALNGSTAHLTKMLQLFWFIMMKIPSVFCCQNLSGLLDPLVVTGARQMWVFI